MNMNQQRRDEILKSYTNGIYSGGIMSFSDVPLNVIKALEAEGFLDLNDAQNDAPTTKEFIEFLEKHNLFTLHGYAVSCDRIDYRISIEGLEYDKCSAVSPSKKDIKDFKKFCNGADEIDTNMLYSWWD